MINSANTFLYYIYYAGKYNIKTFTATKFVFLSLLASIVATMLKHEHCSYYAKMCFNLNYYANTRQ